MSNGTPPGPNKPKTEQARQDLARFSFSGRSDHSKTLRKRSKWAILLGAIFIVIGLILGSVFTEGTPKNLSGSIAFIGIFMVGFGLVTLLASR